MMEGTVNQSIDVVASKEVSEDDFFEELYSNSVLKDITLATFFLATIFGLAAEFGITWYEKHGNHPYRTVINQLFSTVSWLIILIILFAYIPTGMRYLIGPFNETYCDVTGFVANVLGSSVILTLDCIIVLRYIFIFKLSNFAVLNDDLIATFLQITTMTVSLWISFVKRFSIGRMSLNYYMCAGKNPIDQIDTNNQNMVIRKLDITNILYCMSFALHIVVYLRIYLYQRKMERQTEKIEIGRGLPDGSGLVLQVNPRRWSSNMPKSLADLTTQTLCMTFFLGNAIVTMTMNQKQPSELNEYPNRWLAYFSQIICFAVAILGICFQYYVKNPALLRTIIRNITGDVPSVITLR